VIISRIAWSKPGKDFRVRSLKSYFGEQKSKILNSIKKNVMFGGWFTMINLVGTWNMNGNQTNVAHSAWKARLVLNAGGGLVWTETQGANIGATRMGSWKFDGKVFLI
jgi:hypothetical protein